MADEEARRDGAALGGKYLYEESSRDRGQRREVAKDDGTAQNHCDAIVPTRGSSSHASY
jgi:hypothetical protein